MEMRDMGTMRDNNMPELASNGKNKEKYYIATFKSL